MSEALEVTEIWVRAIAADIVAVAMVWREEFKGDTPLWEARIFASNTLGMKLNAETFNKGALLSPKIAAAIFSYLDDTYYWRPDA